MQFLPDEERWLQDAPPGFGGGWLLLSVNDLGR
jgi:hypothetical protein